MAGPPLANHPGPARLLGSAVRVLGAHAAGIAPRVGIVLGSGLGNVASLVTGGTVVRFADVPGLPAPRVPGHRGELRLGRIADIPVLVQCGRYHLYEGHAPSIVVLPALILAALGAEVMIVTNAAGGLHPRWRPGALMLVSDQLNLTGRWFVGPGSRASCRSASRDLYDPELRQRMHRVALAHGITLEEGTYAGVLGPSYETAAEVRALRRLGADGVGMSTVLEVCAGCTAGLRCVGLSVITNQATGLAAAHLSHDEVQQRAAEAEATIRKLIRGFVRGFA